jgi:hypothetical protein
MTTIWISPRMSAIIFTLAQLPVSPPLTKAAWSEGDFFLSCISWHWWSSAQLWVSRKCSNQWQRCIWGAPLADFDARKFFNLFASATYNNLNRKYINVWLTNKLIREFKFETIYIVYRLYRTAAFIFRLTFLKKLLIENAIN